MYIMYNNEDMFTEIISTFFVTLVICFFTANHFFVRLEKEFKAYRANIRFLLINEWTPKSLGWDVRWLRKDGTQFVSMEQAVDSQKLIDKHKELDLPETVTPESLNLLHNLRP